MKNGCICKIFSLLFFISMQNLSCTTKKEKKRLIQQLYFIKQLFIFILNKDLYTNYYCSPLFSKLVFYLSTVYITQTYRLAYLNLKVELLLNYYKTRFQIEFIYRYAKQFTGLHDYQARSKNKLDFHFNTSLSTVNIAKITHWLSIPINQRTAFSIRDINTMYHNKLLLKKFISVLGIPPNKLTNNDRIRELITYGTIAN